MARGITVVIVLGVIALTVVRPLLQGADPAADFLRVDVLVPLGVGLLILVVVWRAFRPPAHTTRAFRDAPVGVGRLLEARATGTSINDQPEMELVLDVEAADGRIIRGALRTIIDPGSLGQLVPGATIPVLYREDGRLALAPDASVEQLQSSLYAARLARGELTSDQVRVATEGTDAQAVVTAMAPTGEIVGGAAVLRITLQVTRPDGSTFQAIREMPTPASSVNDLQIGRVVAVRYLLGDESYVAISTRVS